MEEKYQIPRHSRLYDQFALRVPSYGVDESKALQVPMLIRQMQETALRSTLRLGVSVFDLEPHRLGWVLLGQWVEVFRRPVLREEYVIHTCPVGFEKVFTYRDFYVENTDGQLIATASSTWMLMHLDTRRMVQLPDWIKALAADVPPGDQRLSRASYKMKSLEGASRLEFRVGHHQLDFNGHLTNPFYVEWMLEGLPTEVLQELELSQLNIQYKREARYGDRVNVKIEKGPDGWYHHGLFQADQQLASMQTLWRER